MAKKMMTLAQGVTYEHVSKLLAFQYADGTGEFSIRKSFDNLDFEKEGDLLILFKDSGFKTVSFADIKAAVFANCEVDKIYTPEPLF